jgi:NRAMP (natural resistance-associated macrophage protein)-like metal ion transporter
MGPGIITSNVDNDAGGITTYSLAGAQFGLKLIWSLIPIMIALIVIQEMGSRMGVVTGKGLSDLIREKFGAKITFYLMIGMFLTNMGNVISEFAGVAAGMEVFGVNKFISVPVSALLVWWMVVKGTYKSVEKAFLVACVFYISYIITGVIVKPDWENVLQQFLKPQLSLNPPEMTMVIGLVGTTIAPWMQFYLQASIVEKGIKIEDYKFARFDVVLGSVIVHIVAFFIILVWQRPFSKMGSESKRPRMQPSLSSLWLESTAPISLPLGWSMPPSLQHRSCPYPRPTSSVKDWVGKWELIKNLWRHLSSTAFTP